MHDVYGDQWRLQLTMKERAYLRTKERSRIKSGRRPARDDEYSASWHENVGRIRAQLLKQKQAREAQAAERKQIAHSYITSNSSPPFLQ